jgi:hypothetical protein
MSSSTVCGRREVGELRKNIRLIFASKNSAPGGSDCQAENYTLQLWWLTSVSGHVHY